MMFDQWPKRHKTFTGLAKALTRLRLCEGLSEPLLVAHTTLFEISFLLKYLIAINSSQGTQAYVTQTTRPPRIIGKASNNAFTATFISQDHQRVRIALIYYNGRLFALDLHKLNNAVLCGEVHTRFVVNYAFFLVNGSHSE